MIILKTLREKADLVGVFSAGLCLLHCIIFPLLVTFTSLSVGIFEDFEHWVEYLFVLLSIAAVYLSTSKINNRSLRKRMWVACCIFVSALLLHDVHVGFIYASIIASLVLALLHVRNLIGKNRGISVP